MKKLLYSSFYILSVLIASTNYTFAQTEQLTYNPDNIIDKQYGITMYEPLNMIFGNDSIRNDKNGYAANGYQSDFYDSGKILHKGFYVDGQLKIYKNYYPNGNVERNFRMIDFRKSKMTLYYEDGTMKSNILFIEDQALKWEDYHTNGQLEFVEEYHKSFQHYTLKGNYYESGLPENILELTDKKKLTYTQTYYYPNQQIKEQGKLKYNKVLFDYQKIGKWMFYDENGTPTKEQTYAIGKLHAEKNLK